MDGQSPPNRNFNPLPSHEGRPQHFEPLFCVFPISIRSPLTRGDSRGGYPRPVTRISIRSPHEGRHAVPLDFHNLCLISIRSPHARGDSINLQKSIRIYVSLHNKTMIHRFSELYKPLFTAQEPAIRGAKPTEKP